MLKTMLKKNGDLRTCCEYFEVIRYFYVYIKINISCNDEDEACYRLYIISINH